METVAALVLLGLVLGVVILAILLRRYVVAARKFRSKSDGLMARFQGVIDADSEAQRIISLAESKSMERESSARQVVAGLKADAAEITAELESIRSQYRDRKEVFDRLQAEVAIIDERLAFAELGMYEPHFDFDDSEEFKRQIKVIRDEQKAMISDKKAVIAKVDWVVGGSAAKGRTMNNRNIKMTLRAFNNECDVAIANVRWNNVRAMEKRLDRAKQQTLFFSLMVAGFRSVV